MASQDVTFLREQVQRLADQLNRYQEMYPPISVQQPDPSRPTKSWLVDKSLLHPLMVEYDSIIEMYKRENQQYKSELQELRGQLEKVVAENKRLSRELKETVQNQLDQFDVEALKPSLGDDGIVQNLQAQVDHSEAEKQYALKMMETALKEVERLEQELESQKTDPQLQIFENQARMVKEQYTQAVTELHREIQALQEENRACKLSMNAANTRASELTATLNMLRDQLKTAERDRVDLVGREETNEGRVVELQRLVADIEARLKAVSQDADEHRHERVLLEQKCTELQKKNTELEQKEYEYILQIRDNVQMVENAMLEKDQAFLREKQRSEENDKLQDALNKVINEAGVRTKQEVENVRKQCNNNIVRIMEELQNVEMESSEKQAQLERALREKRAVESELEKLYQEGIIGGGKDHSSYDELNKRACHAERLRDESLVKLETLQGNMKRMEMNHRQEKSHLQSQLDQSKERLSSTMQEMESISNDRLKYLSEIDQLKRAVQGVQKDKEAAQRKFNKELACLDQDRQLREREFEVKLQSVEDSHRHGMKELRTLMAGQQRMAAKWKEECQSLSHKLESKVNDLRNEITRQKKRNDDLTNLLEESREKTAQSERLIAEYTNNIRKLEQRVRDSETRAHNASKQVSKQLAKERRMMEEKRLLQSELDKSRLEHSRPRGYNTTRMADPLAISDLIGNGNLDDISQHSSHSNRGHQKRELDLGSDSEGSLNFSHGR